MTNFYADTVRTLHKFNNVNTRNKNAQMKNNVKKIYILIPLISEKKSEPQVVKRTKMI